MLKKVICFAWLYSFVKWYMLSEISVCWPVVVSVSGCLSQHLKESVGAFMIHGGGFYRVLRVIQSANSAVDGCIWSISAAGAFVCCHCTIKIENAALLS